MPEKKYWFQPKRFWRWFAAYYPVAWQGWVVTAIFFIALIKTFFLIDRTSHSVSDALIGFALPALGILLLADAFSYGMGAYPSWWRPIHKKRKQLFIILEVVLAGAILVFALRGVVWDVPCSKDYRGALQTTQAEAPPTLCPIK